MAADPARPDPIEVFISYSHADESLRIELEKHLALLQRNHLIKTWHDRKIAPGSDWRQDIDQHIESADLILLLVSPDFIHSEYCWGVEMARALARHSARTARVVPIVLRAVDFEQAPFSHIQALPKDAKPVKSWLNIDEAFVDVSRGIRSVIEDMQLHP